MGFMTWLCGLACTYGPLYLGRLSPSWGPSHTSFSMPAKSLAWPLPSPALSRYRGASEEETTGGGRGWHWGFAQVLFPCTHCDGHIFPLLPWLRETEMMAEVLNTPSLLQSHMAILPVLECTVYSLPSSVPRNTVFIPPTSTHSEWLCLSINPYTTVKFPHRPVEVLISFHMLLYNPIYSTSPIYVQTLL